MLGRVDSENVSPERLERLRCLRHLRQLLRRQYRGHVDRDCPVEEGARAHFVVGDEPKRPIEETAIAVTLVAAGDDGPAHGAFGAHLLVALESVLPVLGVAEIDPFDVWRQLGRVESVLGVPNGWDVTW